MRRLSGYPGCMACGAANPHGFRLELYADAGRVETRYRLPGHLRGFPGAAHGGALCTLLDEVMAWVAIDATGRFHVTGEMKVRFLAPAVPGREVTARGEIAEDRGRYLLCRGELLGTDGVRLAEAEGKYFPVDADRQRELEELWRRDAAALGRPEDGPPGDPGVRGDRS